MSETKVKIPKKRVIDETGYFFGAGNSFESGKKNKPANKRKSTTGSMNTKN